MKRHPDSIPLLLKKLAELNVHIWSDKGDLYVNATAGVLDDELKKSLYQKREAIVAFLSKDQVTAAGEMLWPVIESDEHKQSEPFPLSDMQSPYWESKKDDMSHGYARFNYYHEVSGEDLDLARLNGALRELMSRHEVLRLAISPDREQRILNLDHQIDIPVIDLSVLSKGEQEEQLSEIREAMMYQRFHFEDCPLFDIRAVRLKERTTLLCMSWSFINLDAWSLPTLFREWKALYDNPNVTLPTIAISYRDYVLAERQLRSTGRFARDREYWSGRLDEFPNGVTLPIHSQYDSERHPVFTRRRYVMPEEKWRGLKGMGKVPGVTPTGILLAAFCEVLSYWSEQMHFSLCIARSHRLPLHEDVCKLVGNFTSRMLLEVDLRKTSSFKDRAVKLQRQLVRDGEHDLISSIEVVREWSRRKGVIPQSPASVMFTDSLVPGNEEGEGKDVRESFGSTVYGVSRTPGCWLDAQVMEVQGDLVINWDAHEDIFLPGVLDAMFGSYGDFLDRIGESFISWDQSQPLRVKDEQVDQGGNKNAISVELPGELLHEKVIRQAMEKPHADAVITSGLRLSYGELVSRSSALAEQLSERGLRTGEVVAVVISKGWEQIVAVLGTLLAGGAYMPLDPELPGERRQQLFEQSGTRFAVVMQGAAEGLEIPLRIQRVEVMQRAPASSMSLPEIRQNPEDLAYVIFASDSKGVPKGRMINHRSAVNTLWQVNRHFDVNQHDRALAVSSWSFDLSVYDIFGLLAVGGAIVIPDDVRSTDPEHWHDLICKHNVTLWYSSPPLANMLANYMEGFSKPPDASIRLMLLSGNWIPAELSDKADMLFPKAELVSLGAVTLPPVSGGTFNH